ncbi:uncharacterized protein METZ01_LOCUS12234 [marine metagenome]|uniref:Uncharacterized protein n=1 Tax=marine metagenome TaxID=408172 RepID=A0A381NXV2_9ZZZZ
MKRLFYHKFFNDGVSKTLDTLLLPLEFNSLLVLLLIYP